MNLKQLKLSTVTGLPFISALMVIFFIPYSLMAIVLMPEVATWLLLLGIFIVATQIVVAKFAIKRANEYLKTSLSGTSFLMNCNGEIFKKDNEHYLLLIKIENDLTIEENVLELRKEFPDLKQLDCCKPFLTKE